MKKQLGRPPVRKGETARITLSVDPMVKEKMKIMSEVWNTSMTQIIETVINEAWDQGKFNYNGRE